MIKVETADGKLVEGVPVWPDEIRDLMEKADFMLWEHAYDPGLHDLENPAKDWSGTAKALLQWQQWYEANFGYGDAEQQDDE